MQIHAPSAVRETSAFVCHGLSRVKEPAHWARGQRQLLDLLPGQLRGGVLAGRRQDTAADEPVNGGDVDGEDASCFVTTDTVSEPHCGTAARRGFVLRYGGVWFRRRGASNTGPA